MFLSGLENMVILQFFLELSFHYGIYLVTFGSILTIFIS